jgi:hypothetical protein
MIVAPPALRLFDDEQHDKDDRYDGAEGGSELPDLW